MLSDPFGFTEVMIDGEHEEPHSPADGITVTVPIKRPRSSVQLVKTFPGIDIGGSLCKIAIFEPPTSTSSETSPRSAAMIRFITSSEKFGSSGVRDPVTLCVRVFVLTLAASTA